MFKEFVCHRDVTERRSKMIESFDFLIPILCGDQASISRIPRWHNGAWEKILPRPHPTGLARWAALQAGCRAASQSPGSSFSIPETGVGYRKSGARCLVLLASIPATIAIGRWLGLA